MVAWFRIRGGWLLRKQWSGGWSQPFSGRLNRDLPCVQWRTGHLCQLHDQCRFSWPFLWEALVWFFLILWNVCLAQLSLVRTNSTYSPFSQLYFNFLLFASLSHSIGWQYTKLLVGSHCANRIEHMHDMQIWYPCYSTNFVGFWSCSGTTWLCLDLDTSRSSLCFPLGLRTETQKGAERFFDMPENG